MYYKLVDLTSRIISGELYFILIIRIFTLIPKRSSNTWIGLLSSNRFLGTLINPLSSLYPLLPRPEEIGGWCSPPGPEMKLDSRHQTKWNSTYGATRYAHYFEEKKTETGLSSILTIAKILLPIKLLLSPIMIIRRCEHQVLNVE